MPSLKKIWPDLDYKLLRQFGNQQINKISCNSKNISLGDLFVAIKGAISDGHKFIEEAVSRGAKIIVLQEDKDCQLLSNNAIFIKVADSHSALIKLASNFYDHPTQKIKIIGITGTNGKTTVLYLVEKILNAAGFAVGVIGTISYKIGDRVIPATNTTPGPLELQSYFKQMVDKNNQFCVMEVSSHSLEQKRVEGVEFCGAIFTNLASDHLDYHLTVENYFAAKAKLFENLNSNAFAAINLDDKFANQLLKLTRAKTVSYALEGQADFIAENISLDLSGTRFVMSSPKGKIIIQTKLIGKHNVYNILAAASLCSQLGIALETIKKGVEALDLVPGRLENIDCGQPFKVLVDFAHTEDALMNILSTVKLLSKSRLLLVFGCGGDRDKTKRKKMGGVAGRFADLSIITSDNPRSEDPQQIAQEIAKGFDSKNYKIVLDRQEAIKEVISLAKPLDIVIIAGKGHEAYQVFRDRTVSFDDRLEVRKILGGLKY
ncbi:MAG: UDP-N-acetylmuramoyl-L-alanyl-D-glutamate--2,6-diaminopimelate ligase [Candidatus Omnitrophota bacterium]|nr:UDP-N-acetylmuramoyl-L-alanyl-D-glutamate--2,6-diaminopimelate ligase [Candidatus Omnitrophota bacterium]